MLVFPFQNSQYLIWIILIVTLWTIPWKAMALWRSARKGQVGWFVFFLLINTVGIIEIIYLKFLSELSIKSLEITKGARKEKAIKARKQKRKRIKQGTTEGTEKKREITSIINPRKSLMEQRNGSKEIEKED